MAALILAFDFSSVISTIADYCVRYGLKLIGAILVLVIGLWLAKVIVKLLGKSMIFKKMDKDVRGYMLSALKAVLSIIVLVTVVAIMGVPMASIVAVIASCGVAIGLALQGSLSNFAGGLMLMIFKPFRVGDYIAANGFEGTVEDIGIFNTALTTIDNRRVVLPNSTLSNSALTNNTYFDTRRVDLVFTAEADRDSDEVISVLKDMADSQEKRLGDRPAEVRFDSFGDGCAKYQVRVWCRTADYWELLYALNHDGKKALAENGIKVPLPQLEIHEAVKH